MCCQRQSQRCTGACWATWPRNTISASSRRYLLDTVCLDKGDAEVDSTEGAINDDDLINIMITVRIRLALYWLVSQGRVGGGEGGEGGGRSGCVDVQQACTCVTSMGAQSRRERETVWTGTTRGCCLALTFCKCSVRGLGPHFVAGIKAMQEKVDRARRGAAHLSSGDDAIQPSINLQIALLVNR